VKIPRKIIFIIALMAASAPMRILACPACGSTNPNFKSPMADGMNAGMLTLLGVLATVLACFAMFFAHVMRTDKTPMNDSENPTPKNPTDI
jgi:hypothetical protein